MGWGVFLDRDGTLVPDAGHPVRPNQLRFYAATGAGLRLLAQAGATLLVVSNQSAIARGLLDRGGLARLDRRLRDLARSEGVRLDGTYYCPHHPDFTGPCSCRKPSPGLLEKGMSEFGLLPARSYLVGDSISDLEAARRVGVTPVLVLTGNGRRSREEARDRGLAEVVVGNFTAAARWILSHRGKG
jgi:histidinol-phosphate phosphatase family protein